MSLTLESVASYSNALAMYNALDAAHAALWREISMGSPWQQLTSLEAQLAMLRPLVTALKPADTAVDSERAPAA